MTTRNGSRGGVATSLAHGIPANLPEDGSPYTIVTTTTHQKRMGDPMSDDTGNKLDIQDFENSYWNVYLQTSKGFEFAEKLNGRPYDQDIRDLFGPGVYRSVPIGHDGRPAESFAQIHKVVDPKLALKTDSDSRSSDSDKVSTPKPRASTQEDWKGTEEMPAWMRYQISQAAEERAEARRRADEAENRKEEWERSARDREYMRAEREAREERERREEEARERRERLDREDKERREKEALERAERREREEREREDRERKDKEERDRREREAQERRDREDKERIERREREDREREERKFRSEQFASLLASGTALVTSFIESKASRESAPTKDMNELLLNAIIADKKSSSSNTPSLVEQIQILTALDELRGGRDKDDKEDGDDNMMKMVMGALPMLASMRGGGGNGTPNGQPDVAAMATHILQDPSAISQAAMQNPQGVANTLVAAVKGNPVLKAAVIKAFEAMGDDD